MSYHPVIGQRLRSERARLGLTVIRFAEICEMPVKQLRRIETGYAELSCSNLYAASRLDVDALFVLTGMRADPSATPDHRRICNAYGRSSDAGKQLIREAARLADTPHAAIAHAALVLVAELSLQARTTA